MTPAFAKRAITNNLPRELRIENGGGQLWGSGTLTRLDAGKMFLACSSDLPVISCLNDRTLGTEYASGIGETPCCDPISSNPSVVNFISLNLLRLSSHSCPNSDSFDFQNLEGLKIPQSHNLKSQNLKIVIVTNRIRFSTVSSPKERHNHSVNRFGKPVLLVLVDTVPFPAGEAS